MRLFRILLSLSILCLAAMLSETAQAADALTMRLNDRDKSVRLVLEWVNGDTPDYTLKTIDDQTIEIEFKKPGTIPAFRPGTSFPEITDIRTVSTEGQPLKLWVMLAEKGFRRDLQVGNRLIVDIAQSPDLRDKVQRELKAKADDAAAQIAEKSQPAPAPVPAVHPVQPIVEPKKTAPVAAPLTSGNTPSAEIAKAAEPVIAAPVPKVEPAQPVVKKETSAPQQKLPPVDPLDASNPPIVTLTSTTAFGLAGFIHNQQLWIVVDQPDFLITPRLAGNNVTRFKPFERIDLKDATVFFTDLPPGLDTRLRGEGGDLYWRLILADKKPNQKPAEPMRKDTAKGRSVLWPMPSATHLVSFKDPMTEEPMVVATVAKSTDFTGMPYRFAEFTIPHSGAGLAVLPLVDDLKMATGDDGVTITRDEGLSVTSAQDASRYVASTLPDPPTAAESDPHQDGATPAAEPHSANTPEPVPMLDGRVPLYRFERWSMGGVSSLGANEHALVAELAEKQNEDRAGGLMNVGKMYLSSGRGSEAAGYFRLAAELQPGLADTADFHGLRGAAYAINGQFDLAYDDLRNPGLDAYPDVNVWRAFTLANLQDWRQAAERMGSDVSWMRQYPVMISQPMLLTFAEIALRAGNAKNAEKILSLVDPSGGQSTDAKGSVSAILAKPFMAQRDYLLGEAARQNGKKADARKSWDALLKSDDSKYRTRARLALTVMDYEEGKIKINQAIDQMEGLRYAWRGDELEAAIGTRLGEIYLEKGDYIRGLNVLKDAASLAPDTDGGRRITAMMTDAFRSLYLTDKMKSIDPIDAITVYEKFSELIPAGPEANRLTINLVDRLMEVDLLDRAARVMTDLVDHRLEGDQRVEISLRLAATYLLNRQPQQAMTILNKTEGMLSTLGNPDTIAMRKRELILLRARAMFQSDRVDSALSMLSALPDDDDVLRARADIAWQTGRWSDAGTALERLLTMFPVEANKPPTAAQAEMIRNLAVATNLSGDRGRLAQLRDQYFIAMQQTDLFKEFDVVTRERQTPTLADRDSLNKMVSEVDLFGNFLNAYRAGSNKIDAGTPATAGPAVKDEAAAEDGEILATPAETSPPANATSPATGG